MAAPLTLDLGDLHGEVSKAIRPVLVSCAQVAQRREAGTCKTWGVVLAAMTHVFSTLH